MRFLWILIVCILLNGCADSSIQINRMAMDAGLVRSQVHAGIFVLTTYSKITAPSLPIDVYIEGDGLAWVSETMPSSNPTPRKALALRLATLDPSPNVLYIARPCQFTPFDVDKNCTQAYWTDRRFSEEVIHSVDQAITQSTKPYPHAALNLIGYSGGGAVAVLVASRRSDVATLRTVAGNLDHEMVNRLNEVSQLNGSLNAIDQAKAIENTPQIHFSGGEDDVVPPEVATHFIDAMSSKRCTRTLIVADASHEKGWDDQWQHLLRFPVECN